MESKPVSIVAGYDFFSGGKSLSGLRLGRRLLEEVGASQEGSSNSEYTSEIEAEASQIHMFFFRNSGQGIPIFTNVFTKSGHGISKLTIFSQKDHNFHSFFTNLLRIAANFCFRATFWRLENL